ncbi:hypothetical protein [Dyadobacter sp. LHD-138]|uniref:hypothetical protein n=1 Tax=Dyadobacter sp. LHD-138 TaxID=3071413 RepID=UPI0038D36F1E
MVVARYFCCLHHGFFLEKNKLGGRVVCHRWWIFNCAGDAQQLPSRCRLDAGSFPGPYGLGVPDLRCGHVYPGFCPS